MNNQIQIDHETLWNVWIIICRTDLDDRDDTWNDTMEKIKSLLNLSSSYE